MKKKGPQNQQQQRQRQQQQQNFQQQQTTQGQNVQGANNFYETAEELTRRRKQEHGANQQGENPEGQQ